VTVVQNCTYRIKTAYTTNTANLS